MRELIVAADDFGLTKSVNEGIVRAREEGIVTSINILPSGAAYDDAIRRAGDIGLDEIGAHLALTETGPVTDASKIPSLVDAGGNFYGSNTCFFLKFLSGAINLDEVYTEWKAQLDRVRATGMKITNLSSHEHVHMAPRLLEIFVALAKEYGIPAIRYPHADRLHIPSGFKVLYKTLALFCLAGAMGKRLKSSNLISPDHFLGLLDSGNITEGVVLAIMDSLEKGSTELVCHPGFLGPEVLEKYTFHKNCESELFALTSRRVKKFAGDKGIKLISYAQFLAGHKA